MKNTLLAIMTFFLCGFLFSACSTKDDLNDPIINPGGNNNKGGIPEGTWNIRHSDKVLFLYMVADDGAMSTAEDQTLRAIVNGATRENIGNNAIFIYHDGRGKDTRLLVVFAGADGKGCMDVVYEFDENKNTANVETFKEAVGYLKTYTPADRYVLSMWSHASGWKPASRSNNDVARGLFPKMVAEENSIAPMTIITDKTQYMELEDFSDALQELNTANSGEKLFDMIIFDECYMGGIEVLYEMRDKTNYLVSSVTEVWIYGMPYDKVMKYIFSDNLASDAKFICQQFYDNYANYPISYMRCVATSLFDCTKFDDAAVDLIKDLLADKGAEIAALTPLTLSGMQYYDFNKTNVPNYIDLCEFMDEICKDETDPGLIAKKESFDEFMEAGDGKFVIYKKITPYLYNPDLQDHPMDADKYSGVSSYVPITSYGNWTPKYKLTRWYQRVYPSLD